MNALDFVTLGIISISVIICFSTGLIISIYNLISLLLALILTSRLSPIAGDYLRQSPFYDSLKNIILDWLKQNINIQESSQFVSEAINSMSIPNFFKDILLKNLESSPPLNIAELFDYVSTMAADMAIDAIAMALVFISVVLLLHLISFALRIISRLPVINTFNRIGGGILGLAAGSVLSCVTLTVMSGIFATNTDFPVSDLLDRSMIAHYFINLNFFSIN